MVVEAIEYSRFGNEEDLDFAADRLYSPWM